VSSTRRATLVSNSRVKRSRIWREVTNLPSVPASGLGFVDFTFEMLHALGDIPDAAVEQFDQMLR